MRASRLLFLTLPLPLLTGPLAAPAAAQGAPIIVSEGNPLYFPFNDFPLNAFGGTPALTCNGDFSLQLPRLSLRFTSSRVDIDYHLKGAAAFEFTAEGSGAIDRRIPLAEIVWGVFYFPAFPNLTGTISLDGDLVIAGDVEADMRIGFVSQFETASAISTKRLSSPAPPFLPENLAFEFCAPELSGTNPLELEIAFEGSLSIAIEFAGIELSRPRIGMRSGVRLSVDPTDDPWWSVEGFFRTAIHGGLFGAGETGHALGPETTCKVDDAGGPLGSGVLEDVRWSRTYDQGDPEELVDLVPIDDVLGRGFVAVGNASGYENLAWIARLDAEGALLWEQRSQPILGARSRPVGVAVLPGGDIAVGAQTAKDTGMRVDLFEPDGTPLWAVELQDDLGGTLLLTCFTGTADGGMALGGRVRRGSLAHPVVVRLDDAGVVQWATEYELDALQSAREGQGAALLETSTGRFVLVGEVQFDDPSGTAVASKNALVLALEPDGSFAWARAVGGASSDHADAVAEVEGGDLVFTGQVSSEDYRTWAARLDPEGSFLWSRTYAGEVLANPNTGNTGNDLGRGVVAAPGGAVLCTTTGIGVNTESWLAKIDHDGDVVWFKSLRAPDLDEMRGIRRLDSGLVTWGLTKSLQPLGTGGEEEEMWIARSAFDGMLHFDPANGYDCWNDTCEQADTFGVEAAALPGWVQGMTFQTPAALQAFDVTAATVTELVP